MNARLNLNMDYDFEPQARSRAQTWPMNRPEIKQEDPDDNGQMGEGSQDDSAVRESGMTTPNSLNAQQPNSCSPTGSNQAGAANSKKNSSRRNAWGNLSYADLITQAIQSDAQRRLTLSQIYEWMVANVAFFKDKGDSNSSAGWKNSIRHNLSLHNRFVRVQNEGTGKSSWWMINPDAKPGKSTRRRSATLDTQKYEKKRGRVKKIPEERRHLGLDPRGPNSPISEGGEMPQYNLDSHSPLHGMSDFRSRTNSNASSIGRTGSPVVGLYDEHTPTTSPYPWVGAYAGHPDAELPEIDKMAHLKLHDNNNLPAIGRIPLTTIRQGQPAANYYQNPRYAFPAPPVDYSAMSQVNPTIFSGGTFTSIPEEPPSKIRQDASQNARRPLNVPQMNNSNMFPSDLDSFIETIPVQPGLDCDVDQILQREFEISGNLNFDFDSMGDLLPLANVNGILPNNGILPSINGPKHSGLPQRWQ